MAQKRKGVWKGLVVALALIGVAGCDRSSTDPIDDHGEPAAAAVYDRSSGELLAETHGTGGNIHWDGGLPDLAVGAGLEVDVVFFDGEGHEIPFDEGFEVRARLADGAPEGVVEVAAHLDHLDIEAVGEGTTELVFMLWHGGHADWETPPLPVTVVQGG